jgi:hypothetical protein
MGLIWLTEFTNVNPIKFPCKKFCYVAMNPYEPRIPSNRLTLSGFGFVCISFGGRKWEEVVNCGRLGFLMGDSIKIVKGLDSLIGEWLRNGGIIIPYFLFRILPSMT